MDYRPSKNTREPIKNEKNAIFHGVSLDDSSQNPKT